MFSSGNFIALMNGCERSDEILKVPCNRQRQQVVHPGSNAVFPDQAHAVDTNEVSIGPAVAVHTNASTNGMFCQLVRGSGIVEAGRYYRVEKNVKPVFEKALAIEIPVEVPQNP